ncbi:glycosyltransferase family 4 protein [Agromyces humatus]|uniref:D-inositol 3-phosphate glycosyltransferase n=1 Tax=Agromyces humatus TaxID=279573 RepID=A0ABP4WX73_9MICO|nr:glycosyltransferase family 4 protein [Agromyces humatus]
MGTPRRVALVSSSYDPYVGGVEEHVRQVARRLRDDGVEVEVWTVDRGESLGVREVEGLTVRYLPTPLPAASPGAAFRFLLRLPAAWRRWAAARRGFRPDLLHVHCFGPNGAYAVAMHRRFGLPLIVTSHGETVADDHAVFERSRLLRTALRRALVAAVSVTAPSRFVIDDLQRNYGLVGGLVVPNGVEPTPPPPMTAGPGLGGRYLLGVGRLGRMKGFDLLIDAFARAGLDRDIRLVIAGDGPERESLHAQVTGLGLTDRVELVGRLDAAAVAQAMSAALAVVVPSRMEAFGIVALEAWRSGAPLVMTNRGGAPGFVRDGVDGVLVDPEDMAALVGTLEHVSADESLRMQLAAAGRERVGEFTWARVAHAYEELYAAASDRAGVTA